MTARLEAPSTVAFVPMDAEQARLDTEWIRADPKRDRAVLLEIYEREGWRSLGYRSWPAYARAEVTVSISRTYALMRLARIERVLSGHGAYRGPTAPQHQALPDGDWVYVVRAGEDGPIKIGWSKNPARRFAQLQTTSPVRLIPLGLIAGGAHMESCLHAAIDELVPSARQTGEWFTPWDGLLEYLEEVMRPWHP